MCSTSPPQRHGFTGIELIVCISVVAVLLALVLPAVGKVRKAGAETSCTANGRSCGLAIASYSADYRDYFPSFASPLRDPSFENGGFGLTYFHQSMHWTKVVSPYIGGQRLSVGALCPGNPSRRELMGEGPERFELAYPAGYFMTSDYWLSFTLMSDPGRWRTGASSSDRSLWRSVRSSDIAWSSGKGMLVEPRAYHLKQQTGIARDISIFEKAGQRNSFTAHFADGHTSSVPYAKFRTPFDGVDASPAPILSTRNGYLGIDLN